jgi:uncharacterized protein (DUF362 family)
LYEKVKTLIARNIDKTHITGKRVLLKPNLVKQNKTEKDWLCLRTHDNLILETLHVLLEYSPKEIIVGDAPIQDCVWEELFPQAFYDDLKRLSEQFHVPVKLLDFRRHIFYTGSNRLVVNSRNDEDYIIFDVGKRSYLEPITTDEVKFRVTNYNPDRLAKTHAKGKHQYCVRKDIVECDTVITMPKTKTHRMACITNSLKILVGINGDKDYLPHHRLGSVEAGGDCYKDYSLLRSFGEKMLDFANRHQGTPLYRPSLYTGLLLWKFSRPDKKTMTNAGWYGNDTVWRMVMDLNLIAIYGKPDGTLAETPQRTLYTLDDAIIGGQGNGPLNPDPFPLGILTFSNDSYYMDVVMGKILRLNIDKIPLLREANRIIADKEKTLSINGEQAEPEDLKFISKDIILSQGWQDYDQ